MFLVININLFFVLAYACTSLLNDARCHFKQRVISMIIITVRRDTCVSLFIRGMVTFWKCRWVRKAKDNEMKGLGKVH